MSRYISHEMLTGKTPSAVSSGCLGRLVNQRTLPHNVSGPLSSALILAAPGGVAYTPSEVAIATVGQTSPLRMGLFGIIVLSVSAWHAHAQDDDILHIPDTLTQCSQANISWDSDGGDPYTLAIYFDISPYIERYTTFSNFFIWDTNLPAGTTVSFILDDDLGDSYTSGHVTQQQSLQHGYVDLAISFLDRRNHIS
ncbi:hypothetical protein NUW54_g11944 [Trametes sanguinea]|uniref:Uncharacterized protein n=1 Tax=Trametes sanguinea TaxID=158606 RepID=A0ACC1N5A9_9APHY|nr:hypothetical protein NUW54_g11944 [Trametes sanguinea]